MTDKIDEEGAFTIERPGGGKAQAIFVIANGMSHVTLWAGGDWRTNSTGASDTARDIVLRDQARKLLRQYTVK